jgi:hypothetical protein
MKLLRYGKTGSEKPGLIDGEGNIRDLSGYVTEIAGAALAPAQLEKLAKLDPASLPLVKGKPRLELRHLRPDRPVASDQG